MPNPWDNDPIVGGNPWDNDPVVGDEDRGLEIDIVGGTPISAEQFERENPADGMGGYQKYVAGLGMSLDTLGRGLRDTGTDAARYFVESNPAIFSQDTIGRFQDLRSQQQEQAAERDRTNAPLASTFAGGAGNVIGTAAALAGPALPLRGTAAARAFLPTTVRGNAAQGGVYGLIQPTTEDGGRLGNVAMGAGAGGLGSWLMRGIGKMTPEAKQAEGIARLLGIKLKDAPGAQVGQTSAAARMFAQPEKGAAMPGLQSALRGERETARQYASGLYDQARGMEARVAIPQVAELSRSARAALADFDVAAMPGIARRLSELDELSGTPYATQAKLQAMERWRARISTMSPKDGSPEQAASGILKRHYDDWLNRQFNDDMISGRPEAVQAWREAKSAWSDYKSTFDANKVIRELATKPELTQEQMRGWIFNASSLGAKREAGAVVARLNGILGPDSPQMQGLRSEVLTDIAEPLFLPTPNIAKFVANYDKFIANNPTLRRELFPQGMAEFDDLVKFARGISQRPGAVATPAHAEGVWDKAFKAITRYTVGHGIAQGGVRVKAATGLVDRLRQATAGSAARKAILREYLGADPTQPMFPRGAGPVAAAWMLSPPPDAPAPGTESP